MKLQILGTGCSRCKTLTERVGEAVKELSIHAEISKVEEMQEIVKFGVMSTPALVVDGEVAFAGRVPTAREISDILQKSRLPE